MKTTMYRTWRIGLLVIIAAVIIIAAASINYVGKKGYDEMSFRWSFGGGKAELRNTQEFDAESIRNLEINLKSENIIFLPSQDEKIMIKEYLRDNNKEEKSRIRQAGDTLCVDGSASITIYMFSFGGEEKTEIYLPESFIGNISVHTGSGSIKSDYRMELSSLEAETGSGSIRFNQVYGDKIKALSGSGNISFVQAEGVIREFSTNSGNINVESGAGDTLASAGSGNIKLKELDGSLLASVSSGNIGAEFIRTGKDIDITSSSGSIRLEIPEDSSFSYNGSSGSGSINTDFDELLNFNRRGNSVTGIYGGNENMTIRTKASSGNTSIKFH